ncbi:hypothetical protein ACFE04_017026 [Oxalis oulophora]
MAKFQPGQRIEVSSSENGYKGSYYGGTIICEQDEDKYLVQYDNLATEDDHQLPLQEVVSKADIRPRPPPTQPMASFARLTLIDAFDRGGWWIGRILRKEGKKYWVYFDHYDGEFAYPIKHLRLHQECIDGAWNICV